MRIAITGGNGFVGSHIVEALHKKGHELTCLVRKTSDLRWIEQYPISFIQGDLGLKSNLEKFVADQDIIIHCAARTVGTLKQLYLSNVLGTKNLLDIIEEKNPQLKQFIFISSQEAAGKNRTGRALDESMPLKPITGYGKSKAWSEKMIQKSSLPYTIFRPGPIYGPRDPDFFVLIQGIKAGIEPYYLFKSEVSMLHVDNLIKVLLLVLNHERSFKEVYYVSDGTSHSFTEITRSMRKYFGRKTIKLPVTRFTARLVGYLSTVYSYFRKHRSIINREKTKTMVQSNLVVSIEKAKEHLEYEPSHSSLVGLEKTVDWYREHKWFK